MNPKSEVRGSMDALFTVQERNAEALSARTISQRYLDWIPISNPMSLAISGGISRKLRAFLRELSVSAFR